MFFWPVRVYYEDTDSGGVVYYANYLKYMERARTEWLRSYGIEQDDLRAQQGIIFAVHSVMVNFLRSGQFNDLLYVSATVIQRRRASLTFDQQVMRLLPDMANTKLDDKVLKENMTVLCAGQVKIACLDAGSMRPRHIPEDILTEISRDS
jgi:acyl-CoA thioester hydrolase